MPSRVQLAPIACESGFHRRTVGGPKESARCRIYPVKGPQIVTASCIACLLSSLSLFIQASMDHRPGPAINRKLTVINCAYSDRISCKTAQNPTCGGTGGKGRGDVPKNNGI